MKFTLNHPEAPFLADLGMDFASIVSKEYADKLQADGKMEQMNQMPIGTGPFTFVDYQPDAVIRYKANPDYFRGKEKIDDLVFAITPDASVARPEAQGRRMPHHAVSERRGRRRPQGRCRTSR